MVWCANDIACISVLVCMCVQCFQLTLRLVCTITVISSRHQLFGVQINTTAVHAVRVCGILNFVWHWTIKMNE